MIKLDLVCVVKWIKANENKLPLVTDGALGVFLDVRYSFVFICLRFTIKRSENTFTNAEKSNWAPPGGQNHVWQYIQSANINQIAKACIK